ncbi:hypothetical protein [Citrobacter freundii]|uniref:hypothetical protein n=1 Tax=Citrobacter freundii TaxID=546 RepID=UPI000B5A8CC8|nr:hypothetical protein [Citrobacter freundii]ASK00167.1 hypothetical protein CFA70_08150 [Citrobacter freundii]EKV5129511.1 hypothetical protein [Citrobacter freundii]ELZ9357000.1 hypothetical protein [Citrobacter freundii]OYR04244.1 hypothetical protein B9P86_05000 [Citrobacter freundii]
MTSREKFEAFLVSEYEWGNDALNAANFHGDDATGYYTGGDFIYDGQSCSECLFWAWRGWQAAELASEQKLTDMAVQLANAESKCRELAAENAEMRSSIDATIGWQESTDPENGESVRMLVDIKTPATDAFLAEVRASAVSDYANKRGFSFHHGSIHAHFGNGDVMVGSVTFDNGDAGINFAPVREKTGGVGTHYEWTKGKTAEQVDSVFVIASSNAEGLEVIRDKLADAIAQLRQGGAV